MNPQVWNEDVIDHGEIGGDKIHMALPSWPVLFRSGINDGDMIIGRDYTQPDKAGSFGFELTNLYKMSSIARNGQTLRNIDLESAVKISNTLAGHTTIVFLVLSFIGSVTQEIPFNDWTIMESVLQHVTQNPTQYATEIQNLFFYHGSYICFNK